MKAKFGGDLKIMSSVKRGSAVVCIIILLIKYLHGFLFYFVINNFGVDMSLLNKNPLK